MPISQAEAECFLGLKGFKALGSCEGDLHQSCLLEKTCAPPTASTTV